VYANIAPIAGDSGYPSIAALLHLNGAADSTVLTDTSALASNWTVSGNAKLSTAQKKFGTASLALEPGSYATSSAADSNFVFGTSGFTIECWYLFPTAPTGQQSHYIFSSASLWIAVFKATTTSRLFMRAAGVNTLTTALDDASSGLYGVWNHVAISRSSTTTRLFLNGTEVGSVSDSSDYGALTFRLGSDSNTSNDRSINGFVDEFRISKTTRYASNFSVQTAEFQDNAPVVPALTLPSASSNTNMYRVWNLNSNSLAVTHQSGQGIDGATGSVSLAQGAKSLFINDGATGWRNW
jgi:hypothetical protein